MVLLTHPFGNANVRAVLDGLNRAGLLTRFVTTLGWSENSYPFLTDRLRGKLRRTYAIPADKIDTHPWRESVRLLAGAARVKRLTRHEFGWASIDRVWQILDREAAHRLRQGKFGRNLRVVYAYEDCAEELFRAACDLGLRRVYDLPIAYWQTAQRLLGEEAQRYPEWEPTLVGTRDSEEKLSRKSREIELAELVICPSRFVMDSLPDTVRAAKRCVVAPFGSPIVDLRSDTARENGHRPLRLLFAGALTQRKGLADLFAAMKLIRSATIELVVMGSALLPIDWYRDHFSDFTYEPPRRHRDVLRLMQSCDVLILPSIVEGRALVQQEAMACGLPVIATRNAGADDIIIDGETGFLVPIRSPDLLAEKISWCAANRSRIRGMGIAAQKRAQELSWHSYGETVVAAIRGLVAE